MHQATVLIVASLLLPTHALVFPYLKGIGTYTTFNYHQCTSEQRRALVTGYSDARTLAEATIETGWFSDYVDMESEAALDYWGPSKESAPYAAYIYNTFYRATQTFSGQPGDWWNDRYVDVYCGGRGCEGTIVAYNAYTKEHGGKYPELHYCDPFFSVLENHDDLVKKIKADGTGRMKQNLRNLRSRATTVLHEWLHIKNAPSEVCIGGCQDVQQKIGNDVVRSYKAGRAKLLARRSAELASRNNDNYAYFAMAKWMQKNLGTYPQFPTMWNPNYNRTVNEDFETAQPGAPDGLKPFDIEDAQPPSQSSASLAIADGPIYPDSAYPFWFHRNLKDLAVGSVGMAPPQTKAPVVGPTSGVDKLVCETSDGSPFMEDCNHAFGALYMSPTLGALRGRKDKTWWASYVHSCAIAIYYQADWTDACNATLADVRVHATHIFNNCGNGAINKVGGHIPFGNPACPAQIQLMSTYGQQPPQGGLAR